MSLLSDTKLLRAQDLNHLVILRLLFATRNVSKTAQILDVKQPAVSKALALLRETFDDPLLVRSGNEMRLTSRALELAPRLESALTGIAGLLAPALDDFNPATCDRTFNLAVSEYVQILMGVELVARLSRAAPHVVLNIALSTPRVFLQDLPSGAVDMLVAAVPPVFEHFHTEPVCTDDMVALAPAGLRLPEPMSLETFCALPCIDYGASKASPVGAELTRLAASRQLERKVVGQVASYLMLPHILTARRAVSTAPRRMARKLAAESNLTIYELDFAWMSYDVRACWTALRHKDPLRELVLKLVHQTQKF